MPDRSALAEHNAAGAAISLTDVALLHADKTIENSVLFVGFLKPSFHFTVVNRQYDFIANVSGV